MYTGRIGRRSYAVTGDTVDGLSIRQDVAQLHALTLSDVVYHGGPGIISGGAATLASIDGGTSYPAMSIIIGDGTGYYHFSSSTPTSIDFAAITTGTIDLYAVAGTLAGYDAPLPIDGRPDAYVVTAVPAGGSAPVVSHLLGTGVATAGAVTSYTVDSGAYATGGTATRWYLRAGVTDLLIERDDLLEIQGGDDIDVDLTGDLITIDAGTDLARLSGASFTGNLTGLNGKVIVVRDTGYGPPTAGAHTTGAHWWDLAGAHYYCTAGGTPGTWVQLTPGVLSSAPSAGSFNGGAIPDGYRYFDTTDGFAWQSWRAGGASHYRWQSAELFNMGMDSSRQTRTSAESGQSPHRCFWPSDYDIRLVKFTIGIEGSGTYDVSNYWTVDLQKWIPSSLADIDTVDQTATTYRVWDVTPTGSDGHIAVASYRVANVMVTATGSPGPLYTEFPKFSFRWLK